MKPFRPALLIIDFQEDFCPPNGPLAVKGGRDIATIVNSLLSLPFVTKIATCDWHPADHVSFAANHAGAEPFVSTVVLENPSADPESQPRSYATRLWPVHCVQGTPGAQLVPEMNLDLGTVTVLKKGTDAGVEMYSAFRDSFEANDSGLAARLRGDGVTDVYIAGLALDYCVRATAEHAVQDGFAAYVVAEGTRAVDEAAVDKVTAELEAKGVRVVSFAGEEVDRVRRLAERV